MKHGVGSSIEEKSDDGDDLDVDRKFCFSERKWFRWTYIFCQKILISNSKRRLCWWLHVTSIASFPVVTMVSFFLLKRLPRLAVAAALSVNWIGLSNKGNRSVVVVEGLFKNLTWRLPLYQWWWVVLGFEKDLLRYLDFFVTLESWLGSYCSELSSFSLNFLGRS